MVICNCVYDETVLDFGPFKPIQVDFVQYELPLYGDLEPRPCR